MTDPIDPKDLGVKIFADGADLDTIRAIAGNPLIRGFTTNPTLMRKSGVPDYKAFALEVLAIVPERPVSFEVFADDLGGMARQAAEIASWGDNVNVKIPITNTGGESTAPVIGRLSRDGVVVNVTAIFTLEQTQTVIDALDGETPAILSVFAGRIADSGRDPVGHMKNVVEIAQARPKAEVLWASPREILNIYQADAAGCHIITVTADVLGKLPGIGKDLDAFSLETVKMFHDDARAAGYVIDPDGTGD